LRVVVFTLNRSLEHSPWWPIIQGTPGVRAVLVLRQVPSRRPGDVLRRLRRNIAKHGLIFLPYRVGVLAWELWPRRPASPEAAPLSAPDRRVECEVLETTDMHLPEVRARIEEWRPDIGVSVGAPILRPTLFQLPRLGTVNLHLGKVPDFRGAPPGFWELYTGAREIGATVHWVTEGLDSGPVIARAEAPIYETDTLASVEARATELGRGVLAAALHQVTTGTVAAALQPAGGRTFRSPTLTQRARLAGRLALRDLARSVRRPWVIGKALAVLGALAVLRPLRDLWRTLRATHPVRVFTFHRISDLCRDAMTVSPEVFRRQVDYVRRYHDMVPLERALDLLASGARLRRPVAVLTFDDGYRSVFDHAWPAMAARGVLGCCFVCTDLVGTDRRFPHDAASPIREHLGVMAWQHLRALRRAGWSVGGHTATHARLSLCESDGLRDEVARPLTALRDRLGVTAVAMAYPFGQARDVPPGFPDVVRRLGYVACFSNYGGENGPPAECWNLRRIDLGGDRPGYAWKAYAHGIDLGRVRAWWNTPRPEEPGRDA
jgi:folate-dependent phosphoribosylglycinamide formyltransferase PurN/peptidoglycan/xylan/chitin deacetylase (PgdA/CDA1 family)